MTRKPLTVSSELYTVEGKDVKKKDVLQQCAEASAKSNFEKNRIFRKALDENAEN